MVRKFILAATYVLLYRLRVISRTGDWVVARRSDHVPVQFQVRFRIIQNLPTRMPDVEHLFMVYLQSALQSNVSEAA